MDSSQDNSSDSNTKFKKGHIFFGRTISGAATFKEKMSGDKNPMRRPEVARKNALARKGKNGKTGSKQSEETKKKISIAHKGMKKPWAKDNPQIFKKGHAVLKGEKTWNWKGGITPINQAIRNSLEYKLWRTAVFERDNWTCVWCGTKGYVEADHIKQFALFPELRFAIDNGRTLCKPCHNTTKYGRPKL